MLIPKSVLFDLDGTLLDTEILYQRAWKKAADTLGYPLSEEQALSLRSLDRRIADTYFAQWFGSEEVGKRIRVLREKLMENPVIVAKDGAKELALFLREKGIPYCVCSASPLDKIKEKLTKGGLGEEFDSLFSARDVARGKPAPDVYLSACASLGLAPKDCLAVEDSPNGFESAYAAGLNVIYCVDLSEPDESIASRAYRIVHGLDEIIPLLS